LRPFEIYRESSMAGAPAADGAETGVAFREGEGRLRFFLGH
jgi:hypothetical protein